MRYLRTILPPFLWLVAAMLAVVGSQKSWLWLEIFSGWALICLNAFVAWWGERVTVGLDPAYRTMRALTWQVTRAGLLAFVIILIFRLAFLNFNAFLFASFAGYLTWSTGRILRLHLNSLR